MPAAQMIVNPHQCAGLAGPPITIDADSLGRAAVADYLGDVLDKVLLFEGVLEDRAVIVAV